MDGLEEEVYVQSVSFIQLVWKLEPKKFLGINFIHLSPEAPPKMFCIHFFLIALENVFFIAHPT